MIAGLLSRVVERAGPRRPLPQGTHATTGARGIRRMIQGRRALRLGGEAFRTKSMALQEGDEAEDAVEVEADGEDVVVEEEEDGLAIAEDLGRAVPNNSGKVAEGRSGGDIASPVRGRVVHCLSNGEGGEGRVPAVFMLARSSSEKNRSS